MTTPKKMTVVGRRAKPGESSRTAMGVPCDRCGNYLWVDDDMMDSLGGWEKVIATFVCEDCYAANVDPDDEQTSN